MIGFHTQDPAPFLSVMILTIPGREHMLHRLLDTLDAQDQTGVEIMVHSTPRQAQGGPSVGRKRQECIDESDGKYVAFIDDDDMVSDDYLYWLRRASFANAKVMTFQQEAVMEPGANPFTVTFDAFAEADEPTRKVGGRWVDIRRRPWHMCAWRNDIARRHAFKDVSWGEDADWISRCSVELHNTPHIERGSHIDKILHKYRFDPLISACNPIRVNR